MNYTISSAYDEPNAKFSVIFSNAAMIECKSVFNDTIDALKVKAAPI